ncbi:cell wall hydrolase [Scatolibacter rhodanostii]|uniref:cell wall hydrolase n=1 Tax=Scatolibacter rhodanostii TaxID=2014781 RepID=UPI000C083B31|nr:cell wall hydrolase [Scatolibacter rhodanostii]
MGVDEDGEEIFEEKKVKSISVQSKVFDSWVHLNQNVVFKEGEYDSYKLLNESGVFMSKKEIESPFKGETFQLAKRYGYNLENDSVVENSGIDIITSTRKKVSAGIKGTVTDTGDNYVKISHKKKEIVYVNLNPTVSIGQEIKKNDIIGNTSGDRLHIDYYKDGKEMCPYIFIKGASGFQRNVNGNMSIVEMALSQLGQVGGRPYWSWYGFGGRVDWCAIFVSWCADRVGYLSDDIVFKHASCTAGVNTWKSKGLWQERQSGYVPKPGDLIYFLWDLTDYGSDHIGIVESSDENFVHTVEGNSGDRVEQNTYSLTNVTILGYATPLYPTTYGKYSEEDLYWLSRVINAEAGSDWLQDTFQQDVGSVVLNRTKDSRYPNTVKDVIFQRGQYECVTNGSIYKEPSAKSIANAKYILEKGSTLPKGVVGQSQFVQGTIYSTYYDRVLGTTTYFCYI